MIFLNKTSLFFSFVILTLLIVLYACEDPTDPGTYSPTPYVIEVPAHFPTLLNIPADNPMTEEGVALGEMLFHDELLCGYLGDDPSKKMSCATCHVREHGYEVGLDHPRFPDGRTYGLSGDYTPHSMLPLVNLVFNHEGYFWSGMIHSSNPDPSFRTLEDIVLMGIIAPHEMNSTPELAIAALRTESKYPEMFRRAFGSSEITIDGIQKSIAQYIRTLISANSKFDQYLRGEVNLTSEEWMGYILFTTEEGADCFHCHGGSGTPLFTTHQFYNNGLTDVFDDPNDRYSVTQNERDRGAYRAPTLRNIAVTAPYFHDGRFKTLDEVLEFYNSGLVNSPNISPLMHKINDGGAQLTPIEIEYLKAFLHTLTDEEFIGKTR